MSIQKLSDRTIKAASTGRLSDGGGLHLELSSKGKGLWFFYYPRIGEPKKRRQMGLGGYPIVSLAEAREEADKWRKVRRSGQDPISVRDRERQSFHVEVPTFEEITEQLFESIKPSLKGDGVNGRWLSPLKTHIFSALGKTPVDLISQNEIVRALRPIWRTKTEAAKKALQRTGKVLTYAAAAGYDVDLQSTLKAKALLGDQGHSVTHIAAMPWQDLPAFYQSLSFHVVSELALKFMILTALRSRPVRELKNDHMQGADTLVVPGDLMKGYRNKTADFRVPLSGEAQQVLEAAKPFARNELIFPGRGKSPMSDRTLQALLDRRGVSARPHGFRSSFRDWVAETNAAERDVAEAALDHSTGGKVEVAYKRTDFLEQRRELMEKWANHLKSIPSEMQLD